MAIVTGFRIGGSNLTNYIQESSDNRRSSSTSYFRSNGSNTSLASYNSLYHPFNPQISLTSYFRPPTYSNSNCGFITKGFCPTAITRISVSGGNTTILFKYKGSGNSYTNGTLYIYTNGTKYSEVSCPNEILACLVGAGGGGAGGGGWWTGKYSYGGGSGPAAVLNIEMPYLDTGVRDFLKIELGAGGNGGSAWNSGSRGGTTNVYLLYGGVWEKVLELTGGKGGEHKNWGSGTSNEDTTGSINHNIDSVAYGSEGYGRIALNPNNPRIISGSYGVVLNGDSGYFRSNLYSIYNTCNTTTDSKLITNHSTPSIFYRQRSSAFASNRFFSGNSSIFQCASSPPSDGDGSSGYWGAGGSGGGSADNGFDSGINYGGRGGNAGLKLYW